MQIDALDAMIEEKNKRIAELEYKIAKASEAFDAASRAFAACDIKRYNQIKELKAELAKVNEAGEVLHAKYRELEAELSDRHRRHTADVEERDRKIGQLREDIKRLEADNARLWDAVHLRVCV
jgi:chromosome segregation ATPase